jgi:hypothetical protein
MGKPVVLEQGRNEPEFNVPADADDEAED